STNAPATARTTRSSSRCGASRAAPSASSKRSTSATARSSGATRCSSSRSPTSSRPSSRRSPANDRPRARRREAGGDERDRMTGHGKGERRKQPNRRGTGVDRRKTLGGSAPQERRAAERRSQDRRSAGQRLEVILDITRQLMAVTDLDALLHTMAEQTANLLGADRATIYVIDRERNELWSRVALGAGEIRFPIGRGIAGTVAQTGETINISDAYKDPRFN